MTLRTLPPGGFADLIINAGDGPTIVINRDIKYPIYIGDDNSVANKGGTGIISIIDPLTFMAFNGLGPIYAVATNPNGSLVDVRQGANNWSPSPIQIAESIIANGLSFTLPATLVDQETITGSGSWSLVGTPGIITTGAAYEIMIYNQLDAPFITDVTIEHLDASGEIVDTELFTVTNYPGLNNTFAIIRGNLRGQSIQIIGDNATGVYMNTVWGKSGLATPNLIISVYGLSYPLPSSMPKVTTSQFDGMIANWFDVSIPATSAPLVTPLIGYTGNAMFNNFVNSGAGPVFPAISSYAVFNGTSPLWSQFFGPSQTAVGGEQFSIALDNRMHTLAGHNTGAAATAISGVITAMDAV
jgi:hypothetical protein